MHALALAGRFAFVFGIDGHVSPVPPGGGIYLSGFVFNGL
jgi:hypothetical protein